MQDSLLHVWGLRCGHPWKVFRRDQAFRGKMLGILAKAGSGKKKKEWLYFVQKKSKNELKVYGRKTRGSWRRWTYKERGSESPQQVGSQLFLSFGKLVTAISPRTDPRLQASYPFHTPTPPRPSTIGYTLRHRATHILSMKIRGRLLLKCLAVEWIICKWTN